MAAVRRVRPRPAPRRDRLTSLTLVLLLAAVPLPRLTAAAHDPATSGAGMGTRVPLLLETGARLGTPASAAGLSRLASPPGHGPSPGGPSGPGWHTTRGEPGRPATPVRLVSLGRLQLEGG